MSALCHKRTFRLAENQDALPDHQSVDLWSNSHGRVRSGEAQPNLRSASCFSTPDFDFSHDLAMARHWGQCADRSSFGTNLLACAAHIADVLFEVDPLSSVRPAILSRSDCSPSPVCNCVASTSRTETKNTLCIKSMRSRFLWLIKPNGGWGAQAGFHCEEKPVQLWVVECGSCSRHCRNMIDR